MSKPPVLIMGFGILLLLMVFNSLGTPHCDGEEMSPGDTCTTVRRTSAHSRTYEEMKAFGVGEGVALGLGATALVGGAVWLVALRRRTR
ncbi:hypothetical protein AQF52_2412 [Streptomyces venezuelae]|uniref:hypothetical protein n=1 Tax=Streptomyces gardneri TaxID=66892 RepID=UPI0006BCE803|nr:hypothetical protein [Streptomyces gardneri]ALO08007.1 hypothetical protein AQF52_2412 [Streptomyces venezuelae]QPK45287.1 hypothetical protein H4W23_12000 [Streptomyces gardneri]WRK36607.1 hypothetical protein U0M97_12055 [Streptomyces venezuelae]CUM41651.1 hypothetical protein BN2537_12267 [Streptomyces venezuelae]